MGMHQHLVPSMDQILDLEQIVEFDCAIDSRDSTHIWRARVEPITAGWARGKPHLHSRDRSHVVVERQNPRRSAASGDFVSSL